MIAPDKVGGSIDRIYNKYPAFGGVAFNGFLLLPKEQGLRHERGQLLLEKLLHRQIVVRHQIRRGGLFMGVAVDLLGAVDDLAGLADHRNQFL